MCVCVVLFFIFYSEFSASLQILICHGGIDVCMFFLEFFLLEYLEGEFRQ